ncbi:MAG: DUF5060 domain-containing protein [Caldilineaceae bacterium]
MPTPYTDLQPWIDFTHESGQRLRRPAFWDGGQMWRVRFAPTKPGGWRWQSYSDVADPGLVGKTGELTAVAGTAPTNRFHRHGFWRMSPGGRNLVHADGYPALLVGGHGSGLALLYIQQNSVKFTLRTRPKASTPRCS